MSVDFDAEQAASMLMQQHGDNAAHYATQWAAALLEAGNRRDARRFVRIVRVIRRMTRAHPEPRSPHRRSAAYSRTK